MGARSGSWIAGGAAVATAGLIGTAVVVGGAGTAQASELPTFEGCSQLREWYADLAEPLVGPWGLNSLWGGDMLFRSGGATADGPVPAAAARDASSAELAGPVGNGATGTNVQEAGVDEPDLVKTDGRLLVTVSNGTVNVLDVTGDRAQRLGRLRIDASAATELLLVGDRAVLLGTRYDESSAEGSSGAADAMTRPAYGPIGRTRAVVTVVDLSDPSEPTVERTEEVDGTVLSAREYDGIVRIVVSHTPQLAFPAPRTRADGSLRPGDERKALARNREVVRAASAQDWLPQRVVRDGDGDVVRSEPLLRCSDVRHPRAVSGLATLAVLTVDPASPARPAAAAVTANGDLVYASADRLYVATMRGGWLMPMAVDGEPAPDRPVAPETELHAFDISGRDTARYVASGAVEGTVYGSWALSELDGRIRVATTRSAGGNDGDNAVTVLAERGNRLVEVGSVGGLGRDESIQAVRWFGDLAVVVTFRQTDPLYTVDLSDPSRPRVRGELKIPGFSSYLHPLGDDLLLGVGQDADSDGVTQGGQVSTFDLGDLDRPTRIATEDLDASWSEVQGDSRAFTYLPEARTAVLPRESYESTSWRTGLVALRVAADGSMVKAGEWWASGGSEMEMDAVRRAVPLDGGRLAAVTNGSVTLLDAADLEPLGGTTELR